MTSGKHGGRRNPPRSRSTRATTHAARASTREDQEDLAAFEDRAAEPTISYEALLEDLRPHGKR
jgi:hypothetical protein